MASELIVNVDPDNVPLKTVTEEERRAGRIVQARNDVVEMCLLPRGTLGGGSVVSLWVRLPDGRPCYVEMTARNFVTAAGFIAGALWLRGEWRPGESGLMPAPTPPGGPVQ